MIVDQLFDNKKNTNESLADEFMKFAQEKGYNPRLRGTPDEERARTDAMLKQRAADRAAAPAPAPVSAEERAGLEAKLKQLQAQFDPNYEYSDDHSFWTQQRGIAQQIGAIKQKLSQGVAEGFGPGIGNVGNNLVPIIDKFKKNLHGGPRMEYPDKQTLQDFFTKFHPAPNANLTKLINDKLVMNVPLNLQQAQAIEAHIDAAMKEPYKGGAGMAVKKGRGGSAFAPPAAPQPAAKPAAATAGKPASGTVPPNATAAQRPVPPATPMQQGPDGVYYPAGTAPMQTAIGKTTPRLPGVVPRLREDEIDESQLDELSLDQIGRGVGKLARGAARTVGGTIGGIAGLPGAVASGYRDAKNYVGGRPARTVAPAKQAAGGAARSMPFYGTNPDTDKPWTYDELLAKANAAVPAAEPAPKTQKPAPKAAQKLTVAAPNPFAFNADNVMKLPGMEKYAAKKSEPAKATSFATGPTGYGATTTTFKPTVAKTAPTTARMPAGGGKGVKAAGGLDKKTMDYIKSIQASQPESLAETVQLTRIANVLAKPVEEMLNLVESKDDVKRIKQLIDHAFAKHSAVSESAFAVRNMMIEHVTQVGAQRRREFARKS